MNLAYGLDIEIEQIILNPPPPEDPPPEGKRIPQVAVDLVRDEKSPPQ